jgi:hypothetical protein
MRIKEYQVWMENEDVQPDILVMFFLSSNPRQPHWHRRRWVK